MKVFTVACAILLYFKGSNGDSGSELLLNRDSIETMKWVPSVRSGGLFQLSLTYYSCTNSLIGILEITWTETLRFYVLMF